MSSNHHQKQTKIGKKDVQGNSQVMMQVEHYQGAIPHPEILKGFEEITPGAADRIIKMAEKEQEHRHKEESKIVSSEVFLKNAGLTTATLVTLCFLFSGVYLIVNDKSTQGLVALITPMVPLLATFFYKKSKENFK